MSDHPLKIFQEIDSGLYDLVEDTRKLALGEGSLPRRFKLLIAMALDASHGTVDGVKALAQAALSAGATKEEITEALRVAQYISGVGSIYTAAHALRDIF